MVILNFKCPESQHKYIKTDSWLYVCEKCGKLISENLFNKYIKNEFNNKWGN